MLPAVLGSLTVGQRAARHTAGIARQDGSGAARSANDSTSQGHPRKPVGTRWEACGGLGLARADS